MADATTPRKKTTRDTQASMANAFAALAQTPAAPAPSVPAVPAAPRTPRTARTPRAAAAAPVPAAMPATQARPPAWDARLSLTLSQEMKRALDLARVADGIEGTARIRAMITLWQDDERLRNRIDKLAKTLR
jgi:hypothetical protein